jgi:hypothetical protein
MGEPSIFSWLVNDQRDYKHFHHILDETHSPSESITAVQSLADSNPPLISRELESNLLTSFRQHFYPFYPIVNQGELVDAWKSGCVSPLLKQCVLFVGSIHTPAEVFTDAGFTSRQDAMESFYRKARKLYDQDVEEDRVCIIQSMFMLQFHFGSSMGHRDSLWWQGGAVNLAQIVGMHRCIKDTAMTSAEKRLWKKMWWLLYVCPPFAISQMFYHFRSLIFFTGADPRPSDRFWHGQTDADR